MKQLLDTGTTGLGGARPKASVRLEGGALAIAKFPHGSDQWDVMAWEATALDLLEAAGIETPDRRLPRVVASVALGNADDHLRNHGFLADRGFWTLSPVFDVNPHPDPWRMRSTSVMGADALPDEAEALLSLAEECSLTVEQARERLRAVAETLTSWKECARSNGIREREITTMAESIETRLDAVNTVAGKG
ncbi:HipA domain-containing protein [Leucobacter sp. HY1908]